MGVAARGPPPPEAFGEQPGYDISGLAGGWEPEPSAGTDQLLVSLARGGFRCELAPRPLHSASPRTNTVPPPGRRLPPGTLVAGGPIGGAWLGGHASPGTLRHSV